MNLKYLPFVFAAAITLTVSGCLATGYKGTSTALTTAVNQLEAVKANEILFHWHQQKSGGLYTTHPSLARYINKVGSRLARVSDFPKLPYEFVIVNDPAPHAIAFLSGKIAINRGLLLQLENEAELAAVLAQNIALSPLLYKGIQENKFPLFAQSSSSLKKIILQQLEYQPLPFETELELDAKAVEYLSRAGYEPKALLSLHFKLMGAKQKIKSFRGLSIHPYSDKRINATTKLLQGYNEGGYFGSSTYQEAIKPLKNTESAYDLLEKGMLARENEDFEGALGKAEGGLTIEPLEVNLHLLKGQAQMYSNRFENALHAFNRAIQLDPEYYRSFLERGILFFQEEKYTDAIEDLEASYKLLPSQEAAYFLAKAHKQLGEIDMARNYFQEITNYQSEFGQKAQEELEALR
ncbi:MAG: M48 family metalloprotease [Simkaniaceae bacterium]|nr:M48 family metalloprotease [Simkaniaceae bacterium]